MASMLQKLLRKSPGAGLIAALTNPEASKLAAPLTVCQPHVAGTAPNHHDAGNLIGPFLGLPNTEKFTPQSALIFPSFPFGFCLDPVSPIGSFESEPEDVVPGGSPPIWADSVKKKRKRKMNKHKYQKLRKRLRRKS